MPEFTNAITVYTCLKFLRFHLTQLLISKLYFFKIKSLGHEPDNQISHQFRSHQNTKLQKIMEYFIIKGCLTRKFLYQNQVFQHWLKPPQLLPVFVAFCKF